MEQIGTASDVPLGKRSPAPKWWALQQFAKGWITSQQHQQQQQQQQFKQVSLQVMYPLANAALHLSGGLCNSLPRDG